jgi:hypothetical protein
VRPTVKANSTCGPQLARGQRSRTALRLVAGEIGSSSGRSTPRPGRCATAWTSTSSVTAGSSGQTIDYTLTPGADPCPDRWHSSAVASSVGQAGTAQHVQPLGSARVAVAEPLSTSGQASRRPHPPRPGTLASHARRASAVPSNSGAPGVGGVDLSGAPRGPGAGEHTPLKGPATTRRLSCSPSACAASETSLSAGTASSLRIRAGPGRPAARRGRRTRRRRCHRWPAARAAAPARSAPGRAPAPTAARACTHRAAPGRHGARRPRRCQRGDQPLASSWRSARPHSW